MADKTITFTQGVKYDTIPPVVYAAGQTVTLREDLAERWLKRGVATEKDADKKKPAETVAAPPANPGPVEIPSNWKFLKADDKIALARKLGAGDDVTADQVNTVITAELATRDAAKT